RNRARDGVDDAARVIGIVEQGCARARLRHLANRAAEVDVDDVRAGRLDHARGLAHHDRVGAEDLNRERVLVAGDAEVAERPLVPVLDARAAHHLGADEPGAEAPSLAAEGLHAHSRHRREDDPRGDLDGADPPGFTKIDEHLRWRMLASYYARSRGARPRVFTL